MGPGNTTTTQTAAKCYGISLSNIKTIKDSAQHHGAGPRNTKKTNLARYKAFPQQGPGGLLAGVLHTPNYPGAYSKQVPLIIKIKGNT